MFANCYFLTVAVICLWLNEWLPKEAAYTIWGFLHIWVPFFIALDMIYDFLIYSLFQDRVSLCSPGWLQTPDPFASASQVLKITGVHHTRLRYDCFYKCPMAVVVFSPLLVGGLYFPR